MSLYLFGRGLFKFNVTVLNSLYLLVGGQLFVHSVDLFFDGFSDLLVGSLISAVKIRFIIVYLQNRYN